MLKLDNLKAADFPVIAYELLANHKFLVSSSRYTILEIEFYLYDQERHRDNKTIQRKSTAGQIYFHKFGFDISFETTSSQYGGILVRSIKEDGTCQYYNGPLVVLNALSGGFQNAFTGESSLRLFEKISDDKIDIYRCERILGKKINQSHSEASYRFARDIKVKENRLKRISDFKLVGQEDQK